MLKTKMRKQPDGSLVEYEVDEDENGLCKRVRVPMIALDHAMQRDDADKVKSVEAVREAAYEKYVERTKNAWRNNNTTSAPQNGKPITGTQNFIGRNNEVVK